jgi:uncharacterized protein
MDVTGNQPYGTPTWIDLGVPDLQRAIDFYGALFGWEFEVGPEAAMRYTTCRLGGRRVAGIARNPDPGAADTWWTVYFATDDCDGTATRITDAGGRLIHPPMEVMDFGRMAIARDAVGAQFGLWQGRSHTFLRRRDGHEIGGIFGRPDASSSAWATTFEVADTDAVVERAIAGSGTSSTPEDMIYGRIATLTDPFGTEFSVITRAPGHQP